MIDCLLTRPSNVGFQYTSQLKIKRLRKIVICGGMDSNDCRIGLSYILSKMPHESIQAVVHSL